jgi:hypothetical protein
MSNVIEVDFDKDRQAAIAWGVDELDLKPEQLTEGWIKAAINLLKTVNNNPKGPSIWGDL